MAWRCEVRTARGGWIVVDEHRDTVGRRALSRRAYERSLLRSMPMLNRREYRIEPFDAPRLRVLFTMTLEL